MNTTCIKNTTKAYLRDGRASIPLKESTSKVISTNQVKYTKPEILLRKALQKVGVKGYRINWKKALGSPDIAFLGKLTAIFVNGCFWHRCPICNYRLPNSSTLFLTI